jgi:RHH-type transcriptional regulator, rel operon repressor / antitoxin RelB
MLALDLPTEVEERLIAAASRAGQTKEAWAADAIAELLDDEEDYRIAIERIRRERPGIPLEDVERELGLAS